MSQADLAALAGTSQATISAYENGCKQPSVDTLDRLLAATGRRLTVSAGARGPARPSPAALRRSARALTGVLSLAAALPTRHGAALRYPRLPDRTR